MLSLHEPQFGPEDEELVLNCLRTSWVSTGGPYVDQFERDFASYVGLPQAISVCNGTVALYLCIEALRRQAQLALDHFEVLVPSLNFIATANAVVHAGGRPVFLDCSGPQMNLPAQAYRDFVTRHYQLREGRWLNRSSGLPLLLAVPVHLMGWASSGSELAQVFAELQLDFIEDAAEALGVRYPDGTHVGSFGKAACFSFNGNKILTTGGGGMIVTRDAALAKTLKHLSTTAKVDNLRFVHDQVGYNFRLVNILAALGVSQLARLDRTLERKLQVFEHYQRRLEGSPISLYQESGIRSNYWIVNLVFPDHEGREQTLQRLLAEGVQCRPLWQPDHLQPAYREFPQVCQQFPHSEDLWKRLLSMPSSPHLEPSLIDRLCDLVLEPRVLR